jgi:heme/copper-type cytochrome/quinol oxidase subunit 4
MAELELPKTDEPEEMGAKTFTRRIALTTAIFAVLLVVSSLGGNSAGREALLAQQQLSDQLTVAQLTSVQEQISKMNGRRMEADLLDRGPSMQSNIRKLYQFMLKDMKVDEARYREEKKKNEEEARRLAIKRDRNLAKGGSFNTAGVFFMLSLILTVISTLAVSRQLFNFAIGSAALGALFMLNGFFLIVRLPFFH